MHTESEFFQPGRTYVRSMPHGMRRRFHVLSVGAPTTGFAHPQEGGRTAFGWAQWVTSAGIEPIGSDYESDFTGWVLDPDAEVVPQCAYRAEFDAMTLGTYTTAAEAQRHCETDVRANVDLAGRTLRWVPETKDEAAPSELCLFGPGAGFEDTTNYTVTPIELQTAYDPDAEG